MTLSPIVDIYLVIMNYVLHFLRSFRYIHFIYGVYEMYIGIRYLFDIVSNNDSLPLEKYMVSK